MLNFIFNTLFWTFSIYGFTHFVFSIIHSYFHYKISNNGIYLFIAVKNQENKIEGFLRSLLFRFLYGEEENIDNIFVIDLNSTDKTADILDLLSQDYDCIQSTDIKSCKKILDSISESK